MANQNNDAGIIIKIISFLIPIVGIFLYFYKNGENPRYARNCLYCGLAGLAVGFVLAIILSPMA